MTEDEAIKLSHHNVEKLLRENFDCASIVSAGERRRSACWKKFGLQKVDEVVYDEFDACYQCKYSISEPFGHL